MAAGNGNLAVLAGEEGADVVASRHHARDRSSSARARTAAEGLDVEWVVADAEDCRSRTIASTARRRCSARCSRPRPDVVAARAVPRREAGRHGRDGELGPVRVAGRSCSRCRTSTAPPAARGRAVAARTGASRRRVEERLGPYASSLQMERADAALRVRLVRARDGRRSDPAGPSAAAREHDVRRRPAEDGRRDARAGGAPQQGDRRHAASSPSTCRSWRASAASPRTVTQPAADRVRRLRVRRLGSPARPADRAGGARGRRSRGSCAASVRADRRRAHRRRRARARPGRQSHEGEPALARRARTACCRATCACSRASARARRLRRPPRRAQPHLPLPAVHAAPCRQPVRARARAALAPPPRPRRARPLRRRPRRHARLHGVHADPDRPRALQAQRAARRVGRRAGRRARVLDRGRLVHAPHGPHARGHDARGGARTAGSEEDFARLLEGRPRPRRATPRRRTGCTSSRCATGARARGAALSSVTRMRVLLTNDDGIQRRRACDELRRALRGRAGRRAVGGRARRATRAPRRARSPRAGRSRSRRSSSRTARRLLGRRHARRLRAAGGARPGRRRRPS